MQEEIFDIKGYEGLYGITKTGKVWSYYKKGFLSQIDNGEGYLKVFLYKNGNRKQRPVHQLVAETFIPNSENKETVDHINRIKTDNRVENLRWATREEQIENQNRNIKKDKELQKELEAKASKVVSKPVEMRDKDNHSILYKTFSSSHQAAIQEFGDKSKNSLINRCANGNKPSAYGYWWCFVGNYAPSSKLD